MGEIEPVWKILIVEDEALLAEEVHDRLTALDHEVVGIADNGAQAIALAEQHRPDLILMDIRIKGSMNGLETAARIYASHGIPVVFTSAHSDRDTLRQAQMPAQYGYVIKPFRAHELAMAVRLAMHRFHAEKSLQMTRLTYAAILTSIIEGVVVIDQAGIVRYMNYRAEEMLEHHISETFGHHVETIVRLHDEVTREPARIPSSLGLIDTNSTGGEPYLLVSRKGRETHVDVVATRVRDHGSKEDVGVDILLRDVTERHSKDEVIWRQAHYDDLTGLPNRSLLRERLRREMEVARDGGLQLALLLLDLDHFKEVNDTHGHDKGDELLREVARRVQSCVRDNDMAVRLGGDEFAVMLTGITTAHIIEQVAQRIVQELGAPVQIGSGEFHLPASIGIAVYPKDADSFEELLKYADQAMYAAKSRGRNTFVYFEHAMREGAQSKLALINDLRHALERQELEVHYQPMVEIATGRVCKAEALLRWAHPTHGMVSPVEFIPLAEESGLIHGIGDWVFDQALLMAKRLLQSQGRPIQISVNVSAVQFSSPRFRVTDWLERMDRLQVPRECICVEITEGVLIEDSAFVRQRLIDFRNNGIDVSIDDFGTGFSSLAYLKEFEIDYLKVDAIFTRGLIHNENDRALTEAIIMMAHKLGLKTIAEGVETVEQSEVLEQFGCDYVQGYLVSRPVPAAVLEALLAKAPG